MKREREVKRFGRFYHTNNHFAHHSTDDDSSGKAPWCSFSSWRTHLAINTRDEGSGMLGIDRAQSNRSAWPQKAETHRARMTHNLTITEVIVKRPSHL